MWVCGVYCVCVSGVCVCVAIVCVKTTSPYLVLECGTWLQSGKPVDQALYQLLQAFVLFSVQVTSFVQTRLLGS